MADFFISYNRSDEKWAEWIGYIFEEEGFDVIIQAWDFRPGSNFVLEMQDASAKAERTVLVLSPDYLESKMAASEWAAAFVKDPEGKDRRIIPVMVRECKPDGLLPAIVQIRIQNMEEAEARLALTNGINSKRAKPAVRPRFPGTASSKIKQKDFPRKAESLASQSVSLAPNLKVRPTELQVRKYVKDGFIAIRDHFVANLSRVSEANSRIEGDLTDISATEFRAELFVDGKSKCICRVFMSEMFGPNSICFSEGRFTGNSANEILNPREGGDLAFSATMSMGFSEFGRDTDIKNMTPDQAGEYLWSRFLAPIKY